MNDSASPRHLALLGLALLGAGAPFVWGWGGVALVGATAAGVMAVRRGPASAPVRIAAWTAALGAPLVGLTAFTLNMAAPNVVTAGQKAAERMAVASLRTLLWAQDRFIEAHGRAGLLAELGGARADGAPLPTPLVRPAYRALQPTPTGQAATDGGYHYQVWVVDQGGRAWADGGPLPPAGARAWRACAWPQTRGATAGAVFCINQVEDILQSDNQAPNQGYDGLTRPPAADACVGTPASPRLTPGVGRDGGTWAYWRGKRTRRAKAADGPARQ